MRGLLKQWGSPHRGELGALVASAATYFFLLASFYVVRPVREEISAEQSDLLAWLQTCTFAGMLVAVPLYSLFVARLPARRFVPWTWRFFGTHLLVFFLLYLFPPPEHTVWVERVFFVWLSIYNLFAVAVFWSFMADLHGSDEAKRLFGFVAMGGSLGAIAGPILAGFVIETWGAPATFLVAFLLLEAAAWCAWGRARLSRPVPSPDQPASPSPPSDRPVGGDALEGFRTVARSPYLVTICLFVFLQSLVGTFAYFEVAHVVEEAIVDREARRLLFARMDLVVSCLALGIQALVVAQVMRRLGVAVALVVFPAVAVAGFLALGFALPLGEGLAVVVALQVALRATRYGFSKPAREVLFTVVPRVEKYKAKAFIDTVVYRGGDAACGWIFEGLGKIGLGLAALAFVTVPLAAGMGFVGRILGGKQRTLAAKRERSTC